MSKKRRQFNEASAFNKLTCTLCGKNTREIKTLTELSLEVFSWYINQKGKKFEEMNGLWKKTSEFFCESCFDKYVDCLKKFYALNRKK